ncbi:MAG TPA: bifunctional UDP-3-O-[3-hydroxymyristoyl] N-acetylglucosamine deacetylase/3-hydroxyacyl-ACP dehydratase [Opitutaceae bacterium]|jgi:UDP-3-O-[3-hydroxymyristoyl] N-acetylglucosamine deacetylase/3-hydroxyacyl-[acyl-carrier-protein] dehydratase|nr:bifunctional UDP-3-O-[3-hydroxymyristoyl] N-acetylglucosamine deacetylase/3-hydroxyacyl-ACP dehydratase [Opitutaceae bacterium]
MKQRTLARAISVKGSGMHTGENVTLTLKPAPVDHGYVFRRIDLSGQPEIRPRVDQVTDLVRATTIQQGHAKIHTVEHVLSALHGCGIDNAVVEMDASEPPILDGSARPFVKLIEEAEPVEQDQEREYFTLDAPVSVIRGNSSIIALPSDTLRISCTSADDRGVHTQHLSLTVDPESYRTQIAPARTFTIYEDIEELLKLGKIRGGSLDCAIVIKGDKVISKEPLRFKDEFVRHKILDIVGDVALLGLPLKAHIVAVRPGHAINAELTRALLAARQKGGARKPAAPAPILPDEATLDIRRILDTLPHRYPFLLIDRVIGFEEGGNGITALKNVTINEPYFNGHFPGNPVMPGVLQLEAMAQAAGILMLRKTSNATKGAYFMSADKVKFRRPVLPGDQLMISAKLTKSRAGKLAAASAECRVDGQVVSSADLLFTLIDGVQAE